ncbi:MAG: gas vesicle protein [Candidatus Rokubacteria bacterium]|nr:gas vesicle protein [Candidatus Rokubacteria bacterium]
MRPEAHLVPQRSSGLVDVLDRILDKGLVVAGDIRVSLAEVELLTIRIRLIVCSIDKAQEIGLDWWRTENYFRGDAAAPALPPRPARRAKRKRDNLLLP